MKIFNILVVIIEIIGVCVPLRKQDKRGINYSSIYILYKVIYFIVLFLLMKC